MIIEKFGFDDEHIVKLSEPVEFPDKLFSRTNIQPNDVILYCLGLEINKLKEEVKELKGVLTHDK